MGAGASSTVPASSKAHDAILAVDPVAREEFISDPAMIFPSLPEDTKQIIMQARPECDATEALMLASQGLPSEKQHRWARVLKSAYEERASFELIKTIEDATDCICTCCTSPEHLFVGGIDQKLRVYSLASFELIKTIEDATSVIKTCCTSPEHLFVGGVDQKLRVYSLTSPELRPYCNPDGPAAAALSKPIFEASSNFAKTNLQYVIDASERHIPVSPGYWGITLREIIHFGVWCSKHDAWLADMNARDMVDKIIKPTYLSRRSVALCNKISPNAVRWVVSHCWDEAAMEFLEDVVAMLGDLAADSDGIFICFLCIYQGSEEDILAQVTQGSANIAEGCFARLLQSVKVHAGMLCVIPNERLLQRGEGLYSRLWCGWEAYQAKENGIPIIVHPKRCTPQHLFGALDIAAYTLRRGTCGNPADQKEADRHNELQIRGAIEAGGGWDWVDTRVKIALLGARQTSPDDLEGFLHDPNEHVFHASLLAFAHFGAEAANQSEMLARVVHRSPKRVTEVLVKLGAEGAASLGRLLYHHDTQVKHAATEALQKIFDPAHRFPRALRGLDEPSTAIS